MKLLALFALLTALVLPSPASASTHQEVMSDLAANQTHSWADNHLGYDEIERRYLDGEHIYVACGFVSEVARRLLRDAGYTARTVATVTHEEWNGIIDGHVMTEVWDDGRWQLYDVDANLRAVDEAGRGVSLVEQAEAVREGRAHWQAIANDPLLNVNEPDSTPREWVEAMEAELSDVTGFYERIMGAALLPADPHGRQGYGGTYMVDGDQMARLNEYVKRAAYMPATPEVWAMLTTTTDVPPLRVEPKPAAPAPAPAGPKPAPAPVAVVPAPSVVTPPPAAAPRRHHCTLRGLRVRTHDIGCNRARRALLRYVRSGQSPRGWYCRGSRVARCSDSGGRARVALRVKRTGR